MARCELCKIDIAEPCLPEGHAWLVDAIGNIWVGGKADDPHDQFSGAESGDELPGSAQRSSSESRKFVS
jgi:hypothetical protein